VWIDDSEIARLRHLAQMAEALVREPLRPNSATQARAYREVADFFRTPEKGSDIEIRTTAMPDVAA
jgi:hypothetical protein